MITATETGHLIVYVTEDPIDDATLASAIDMVSGDAAIINTSQLRRCSDLAREIAGQTPRKNLIVSDMLELFYDSSIPTREAAQVLGKVKAMLEELVGDGCQIVVLCRRRHENLGTRSHFMASVCAAADRVYFRRRT
jgi:hypothetical protein